MSRKFRITFTLSWIVFSFNQVAAQQHLSGNTVIISQPVYNDIYITTGKLVINAPVHGDVVVAAGTIQINDSVYNDVLAIGRDIQVNAFIGDDLRCTGQNISIQQDIRGDIVLAGGNITIDSNVHAFNLAGKGQKIVINGSLGGNVNAVFQTFMLNGRVEGTIDCRSSRITVNGTLNKGGILAANKIEIGPTAWFGKEIRYWNEVGKLKSNNPFIHSGSVYQSSLRVTANKWYYLNNTGLLPLFIYLAMIMVLLFALQYSFASILKKAGGIASHHPVKVFLKGIFYLAGIPLLCVLLLLSMAGIPLAMIVILLYGLLLVCSVVILSLFVTNWINEKYRRGWDSKIIAVAGLPVFIVLSFTVMIPVAGYILIGMGVCYCFGSIVLTLEYTYRNNRNKASQGYEKIK